MTLFNEDDGKKKKQRLSGGPTEQGTVGYYNQTRRLAQNRGKTDEEFDAEFRSKFNSVISDKAWDERIDKEIAKFEEDYDFSDMKINDKTMLRSYAAATLRLNDLELYMNELMSGEKSNETIFSIDKVSSFMSKLREDISKMANDLRITRKARKGDHELNTITFLEDLKVKAKEFYDKRTMLIFCPKCKMLLWQGWYLYPEFSSNKMEVHCHRKLEDGTTCDGQAILSSKALLERGGRNITEIPEAMK